MTALGNTVTASWRGIVVVGVPVAVLLAPSFGGLDEVQHRLLAIFIFAVLAWVLEPIPIFATSVVVITAELFLISDKVPSLWALPEGSGDPLPYAGILAAFADPIIILFLGGFFLAAAATKYRLDRNLARVILAPFGTRTPMVVLALLSITALFSMFMSNTATAAMMLAVAAPVIASLEPDDPARRALVLAIPIGANIGGIGTPIGTPPNAVAINYLGPGNELGISPINFAQWMLFAVPFVVVLLAIAWLLIGRLYRSQTTHVRLEIDSRWLISPGAIIVYVTFVITVLLWLTSSWHGVPSNMIAMIPIAVFLVTGVMNAKDLRSLSWEVLWLVAGGVALGNAMFSTGLSQWFVDQVPFESFSGVVIIGVLGLVAILMSTFISNTATAALLLPLVAALGVDSPALESLGGAMPALIMTTFACSLAMALPVSTPPNSMAHATGELQTRDMARPGVLLGVIGLAATAVLVTVLVAT
ncbi:SLC13 family permease [Gordonia mangrovi]|uniref:SLC13 family permease n=1 Tax=Gordonia mangrovi TaxID=2665643 RepID=UPI0021AC0049|nr:DASS family sodium-coupled anion symporter [Gordonia mangrovi]UVF77809.1 DASS family sodium-coupled anion symporter [Gordonia mangrovi]